MTVDENLPQVPEMPPTDPDEGVPGKRAPKPKLRMPTISHLINNIKSQHTRRDLFMRHAQRRRNSIHGFDQLAEVFTDLFIIAAEQEAPDQAAVQRIRLCSDVLEKATKAYNAFRQNDELPLVKKAFDQLKSDWDLFQRLIAQELSTDQQARIQEQFERERTVYD